MATTSSPPTQASARPDDRVPWMPRVVWAVVAAVVLSVAAIVLQVRWTAPAEGLPDPGALVVDGLPLLRLVTLLAGGAMLGFALSAVALDPEAAGPSAGVLTRSGRRDLAVAIGAAAVLAVASVLYALFTLADVLGIPLGDLTTPGLISTYLWDVEVSRAFLISAGLAVVVTVGLSMARSLGVAATWALVGAVAVGTTEGSSIAFALISRPIEVSTPYSACAVARIIAVIASCRARGLSAGSGGKASTLLERRSSSAASPCSCSCGPAGVASKRTEPL